MQTSKIITFDGNVCTGKTSIISELAKRNGWKKIDEYSIFFNNKKMLRSNKDYLINQKKYLLVDKIRKKSVSELNINLLDRSFVSTSAHVWALYRQGIVDIRKEYFNLLCELIDGKFIILPDVFVYVISDYNTIKKRCKNRQKTTTKNKKLYTGTKYYIEVDYVKYISEFNKRFNREKKSLIINTDKLNATEAARILENKLGKVVVHKINKNELKKSLKKVLDLINH